MVMYLNLSTKTWEKEIIFSPQNASGTWQGHCWAYPDNGHWHSESLGMSGFVHNLVTSRSCRKAAGRLPEH